MMGFFNKLKKDRPDKIGGYIEYHGLTEWWLSSFSEDERDHIVKTFKPMGSSGEVLIRGNFDFINQSPSRLLFDLAGWFKTKENRTIAFRLIGKAEELLNENSDILDVHFFYSNKINMYYKHREVEPEALAIAIEACKKQIAIAPKAKKAFMDEQQAELPTGYKPEYRRVRLSDEEYKKQLAEAGGDKSKVSRSEIVPWSDDQEIPLPSHLGFEQLAIIEEKQGNYEETIKLSKEALKQGWRGDWEKRIERCMKKINEG